MNTMLQAIHDWCKPTRSSTVIELYSAKQLTIDVGETKVIQLGVKINSDFLSDNNISEQFKKEFLNSHYLELQIDNSLAEKGLFSVLRIINLDFQDELTINISNPVQARNVAFENWAPSYVIVGDPFFIEKGDKICSCMLKQHKTHLIQID